jgi:hypothetical protein
VIERASELLPGEDEGGNWPMCEEVAGERKLRPPPSAQPRLHVISSRRLPELQAALLPHDTAAEAEAIARSRAQLETLRAAVLAGLASTLGGDALAAEYVLLAVLSRVISRHGESPVGKLPLALTGCPPAAAGAAASPVGAALHSALSELLPLCARQPITPDALNGASFVPMKDQEANCIWPALLQLPAGASLLLDEAMMVPGKLSEVGVKNIGALSILLSRQKVGYVSRSRLTYDLGEFYL